MGMRFKLLAGTYLLLLLFVSSNNGVLPFGDVNDVFIGLGSLLVFAVIGLWPTVNSGDRAEGALSGNSWADRVDFDKPRD